MVGLVNNIMMALRFVLQKLTKRQIQKQVLQSYYTAIAAEKQHYLYIFSIYETDMIYD